MYKNINTIEDLEWSPYIANRKSCIEDKNKPARLGP